MNSEACDIRNNIIEKASRLFFKNGFHNTTMDQILKEVAVTKKTLHTYFKSKEEICFAYLIYRNDKFSKQISSYTRQFPKGKDQILAIFDYLELFYNMEGFNVCWSVKILSELPPNHKLFRSEIMVQKTNLIDFIETLLKDNNKESLDKVERTLAQKIYMLLQGAIVQCNFHKAEWPIKYAREMCCNLLGDF